MRRKIGKWMGMLFGLIGLPLFLFSAQSFFIRDDSSALFLLLFGGVMTLAGFSQYFRFNRWEKKNFTWYKRKIPTSVTPMDGMHARAATEDISVFEG